jgi:hypothetical protein
VVETISLAVAGKDPQFLAGDTNQDGLLKPGSWRQTKAGLSVCLHLKRGVQELRFGRKAN